jgi:hypothetical protein
MNKPRFSVLKVLKEGDKFLCGGHIYKISSAAGGNTHQEIWARNQDTGEEEKFIHLDRQVEVIEVQEEKIPDVL